MVFNYSCEEATDDEKQPSAGKQCQEPSAPVVASAVVESNHVMNETYVQPTSSNKQVLAEMMTDDESLTTTDTRPVKNVATKENVKQILAEIMTDDDSPITAAKVAKNAVTKGTKQLFSPFEKSPVKKRVQAYENLAAEAASEIPVRTTRTKTRALAKKTAVSKISIEIHIC